MPRVAYAWEPILDTERLLPFLMKDHYASSHIHFCHSCDAPRSRSHPCAGVAKRLADGVAVYLSATGR
jgi:hypothetical protein